MLKKILLLMLAAVAVFWIVGCFNSSGGKGGSNDIVGIWVEDNGWGFEFTKNGKIRRVDPKGNAASDLYDYKLDGKTITHGWWEFERTLTFENGAVYIRGYSDVDDSELVEKLTKKK